MPEKLNNLEWFEKNIKLQLEDVELERKGNKIVLYFDTSDIQTAVMGIQAFYSYGEFKRHRFTRPKTLVNTLTAVGWLGKFNLLPPHLSEFYGKAENNFDLKPTTNWEGEVKRFISHLNLLDGENTYESLAGKSEEELSEIFSRRAGNGVDWFKAIYSMMPWHRKLGVWLSTGLLSFDKEKFDYAKTVKSEEFGKLKEIFDEKRPAETINNIVDAAALAYLIELVESFNQGERKQVPRFFVPEDSNNLWHRVLEELNWHEKFVCRFGFSQGEASQVFRDEDYFLYKITFRRNPAANNDNGSTKENRDDVLRKEYEKLSNLSKQVEEAIRSLPNESSDKQYDETIKKIHINQDLADLIKSLQDYSVLEKEWFKNAAAKEFLKIINESKQSSEIVEEQREIYENKSFKKFITNQLKDKQDELIEELEDFRLASQLYDVLYNSIEVLKKRTKSSPSLENDDFFPFLGLLRYGFPAHIQQRIVDILNKLLSGEESNIRSGCAEAIRCYIDGRKNPAERVNDLMVAAGVLLALENSKVLNKLFTGIEANIPHFSIKVAYAEFLFRRKPKQEANHKKALILLGELEQQWKSSEITPDDKANLSVGLAYLYYWAWHSEGAIPVWDLQLKKAKIRTDFLLNYYIDTAIYYADQAYLNLPDDYHEKKAYALNQYLFYSIEGGDSELFTKLTDRRNDLQSYMNTKAWQFRFDDTLARYYFRRAFLPGQEDKKSEFINWAKDYEDRAKAKSDGDVEVNIFHDKIKQVWEDIG